MGLRRKQQDAYRVEAVRWVVKQLLKKLQRCPKHMKRIRSTNRLFPAGNLKCKALKELFGDWPSEFYGYGRVFTAKLAREVCANLRKRFGLDPSEQQDMEDKRLRHLLKAARKHWVSTMSAMDMACTLPVHEDCKSHLCVSDLFLSSRHMPVPEALSQELQDSRAVQDDESAPQIGSNEILILSFVVIRDPEIETRRQKMRLKP